MAIQRNLKAFVRYDGSGRVVAGSLILRKNKPKVGRWLEIPAYECCNYVPTTTTTTTASPTTTTTSTSTSTSTTTTTTTASPTTTTTTTAVEPTTTTTTTTAEPTTTTTTTIPTPGDCFCYTISNETAGTLLYSYTDCGSEFVRAPINADTISIVCSSTAVTGDDGLIITGGTVSCSNSEGCSVEPTPTTTTTTTTEAPTTTTTTTSGVSSQSAIGAFDANDACSGSGGSATAITLYYTGSLGNGTALYSDAALTIGYDNQVYGDYVRLYFQGEDQVCTMSGNIIQSYVACSTTTTTTTTTVAPTTTTTSTSTSTTTTTTTVAPGYYTWNLYTNQSNLTTTNICNNTAPLVTLYTSVASLGVGVILYTDTALTTQYIINNTPSGGCVGLGTPGSTVWARGSFPGTGEIQGTAGTC